MDPRIKMLRNLEPSNSGLASYQAILEAAAGLFGEFPAQDITLRDILAISGASNQTLYNYFPNGRDDIAIALYDRFQRTMADDFNGHMRSISFAEIKDDSAIIACLSACLARSVFGFLKESYALQSSLLDYLKSHHLVFIASHAEELEEALNQAILLAFKGRFSNGERLRLVRLSVHAVRGMADNAMMNKDFPIDELESDSRKMLRSLLQTGLLGQDKASGSHAFQPYATGPIAILGAPIGPLKRQGILERILKRKRRN